MKQAIQKIEELINKGENWFSNHPESATELPIAPGKWSKKQILGHLIDSAINNLQRFTEIGYQPQPYIYRPYNQIELVAANQYQSAKIKELLPLWISLNKQIKCVMESQTEERLKLKIQLDENSFTDLRFIMMDYPEHLEHHVNQLTIDNE